MAARARRSYQYVDYLLFRPRLPPRLPTPYRSAGSTGSERPSLGMAAHAWRSADGRASNAGGFRSRRTRYRVGGRSSDGFRPYRPGVNFVLPSIAMHSIAAPIRASTAEASRAKARFQSPAARFFESGVEPTAPPGARPQHLHNGRHLVVNLDAKTISGLARQRFEIGFDDGGVAQPFHQSFCRRIAAPATRILQLRTAERN